MKPTLIGRMLQVSRLGIQSKMFAPTSASNLVLEKRGCSVVAESYGEPKWMFLFNWFERFGRYPLMLDK